MDEADAPESGPPIAEFARFFRVAEVEREGEELIYYGEPCVPRETLEGHVWPLFREHGFEVRLDARSEQDPITGVDLHDSRLALVAEPRSIGVDGVPWTNVVLGVLTVFSTLYAGSRLYYIDVLANPLELFAAWPFALSVVTILGVHEFGHYALSRYHGVDASLPYFIPLPNIIGTLGAVIRMRGRMPDRKALFDIGVAGPLAGLVAAVVTILIGLNLPPVQVPAELVGDPAAYRIEFNYPLLAQLLADLTGQQLGYADPGLDVNPVVFGGWVGLFVTFLNLIPVGQLDGGHIVRAMVGERQETLAALVPGLLFALAGYLYYVRDAAFNAVFLWVFWGVFALGIAYAGPATPIHDDALDAKRMALGAFTFVLGVLCFMPVPFEIMG